ncbi:unnamed protein product [Linum tenue]|uniref:Chromatin modification-related protein MEAF6 n=1 Tax=Linum tenue TaxID=586396 RepID=A0AAV0RMS5_9ROSI|nr:unnamed protein product [Linum tenue]
MPSGQKAGPNPAAMLSSLVAKREKLQEELRTIEKQVYEYETSYLQDSSHFGNMLKGFEGFLSSSKNSSNLKRSRKLQAEDRLFSLSSVTSPALTLYVSAYEEVIVATELLPCKCKVCKTSSDDSFVDLQAEELGIGRDDGRIDLGSNRAKGGILPANGQGKPKKGRTPMGTRDAKKLRPTNEAEFDEEDEPL